MPPPAGFSNFSSEMGRAFCKLNFSDRTYRLGSKIRQREDAGRESGNHHSVEQKLTYISNHEDDIQS